MGDELLPAAIADLAWSAASRREFRDEIMRRLSARLGYDGGWFHTLDPSLPLDTGCWTGLDLRHIERARAGWGRYAIGLLELRLAMRRAGGVAQDSEIFDERERARIPFFVDVVEPLAMRHMVWAELRLGTDELAVIGLSRARRGFSRRGQEALRRLLPSLALGDAVQELRARAPAEPACDQPLTAREREVLDLFAHGASYEETARALAITVNTVRAHVRNCYDKLHVASKIEAVLKVRR